jgi:ribonuclease R
VRDGIERQVLYANQPSLFTSGAGPHHALGVTGYARFSAPMREIVGIFTHKEGLERLGLLAPGEPAADSAIRERAIAAGNEAKRRQNAMTKDVHKLVIDQLFADDLSRPEDARPARRGTILGLEAGRLFVELDDFPIELKVYRADLEAAWGPFQPSRDGTSLAFERPGAPRLRVGDAVGLRTIAHAADRWQLRPEPIT